MSVQMTQVDINNLIAGLTATITATVADTMDRKFPAETQTEEGSNTDKGNDIRLTEKSYKRIEKFSGGESEWDDWKYDFDVITRSVNSSVGDALTLCTKSKKPLTAKDLEMVIVGD